MKTYSAYRFREKDPVIDEVRTLVEQHFGRRVTTKELSDVKDSGGPAIGTMAAWFYGGTKRPQSATVEAAGRALGYKRTWVKLNGKKPAGQAPAQVKR